MERMQGEGGVSEALGDSQGDIPLKKYRVGQGLYLSVTARTRNPDALNKLFEDSRAAFDTLFNGRGVSLQWVGDVALCEVLDDRVPVVKEPVKN